MRATYRLTIKSRPQDGRARESKACPITADRGVSAPGSGVSRGSVSADRGVSLGSSLPDATADYILAAAKLAAAAVERGDRAEARRLLESALAAIESMTAATPVLRVVPGGTP